MYALSWFQLSGSCERLLLFSHCPDIWILMCKDFVRILRLRCLSVKVCVTSPGASKLVTQRESPSGDAGTGLDVAVCTRVHPYKAPHLAMWAAPSPSLDAWVLIQP